LWRTPQPAHCLALERLEEAANCTAALCAPSGQNRGTPSRIGIKHFRYVVENLCQAPRQLERGSETRAGSARRRPRPWTFCWKPFVARLTLPGSRTGRKRSTAKRAERIATYRQLTLGATSLWNQWRLGLTDKRTRRRRGRMHACTQPPAPPILICENPPPQHDSRNNLPTIAARRGFAFFEKNR